jgi:hypothetical protein
VRSIVSVLAGFITLSVSLYAMQAISTVILSRIDPNLPTTVSIVNYSLGTRLFWLAWETLSMGAAGFVTARLAASSHLQHAMVMGGIQAVVTLWAMLTVPSDEPLWFWLTGIVLMIPAAWLGGVKAVRS